MKSVGIDIGRFSLKVAQVHIRGRNFKLESLKEWELQGSTDADWKLSVLETLKKLNLNKDTYIIVGLSEDKIIHHRLELPFKKKFEILKTLPFELEDDLPFPLSQCIFEVNPLYTKPSGQTEIFTSICSKDSVQNIISLFHEAGLDPDMISSEGFCLQPLVRSALSLSPPSSEDGLNCFLHLGHKKSFLSIYDKDYPLDIRHIPWGGETLISSMMKGYRVPYAKALQAVKEKSFLPKKGLKLNESQRHHVDLIRDSFEKLVHSLKFQILEIENKYEKNIDQIFLSGGPSLTQNLPEYMSQRLNLNAHILKTSSTYGTSPLVGCVALSLALRKAVTNSQDINDFRKDEFSKKGVFWQNVWDVSKHTVKPLGLFLVLLFVFSAIKINFSSQAYEKSDEVMRFHAQKITGLKGRSLSERNISKFVGTKKKEEKAQNLLQKIFQEPTAFDIFNKLASSWDLGKEAEIELSSVSILKNRVVVAGNINSQFLKKLEKNLKAISKKGSFKKKKIPEGIDFLYDFQMGGDNVR